MPTYATVWCEQDDGASLHVYENGKVRVDIGPVTFHLGQLSARDLAERFEWAARQLLLAGDQPKSVEWEPDGFTQIGRKAVA